MRLANLIVAGALALAAPVTGAERPGDLAQLPLIEQPVAGKGDTLVVFYSGDGGWAGLDKGLTEGLAHAGVPVVGYDSLRYFWTRKTPQQAAADLSTVMTHYTSAWHRPKVILVGYSFGADALPAIVTHLPAEQRARVRLVALVGAERTGDLQFHIGSWLDQKSATAFPLAPLLAAMRDVPVVCIYGDQDKEDACPTLGAVRPIKLSGNHHFDGSYDALGRTILRSAGL